MPGRSQDGAEETAGPHERAAQDEALLQRIRQADRGAFTQLVGLYFNMVYRVAWRTLGGGDGAEDVAQEAFLRLWRNPHQLREGAALKAWLMRVAANLAIDRHRRRGPVAGGELPDVADESDDADRALRRGEAAAAIDEAIAALPERQRLALVLSHFEGLGNREIADTMELTVEAVESLLARARRGLKAALADRWRDLLGEIG